MENPVEAKQETSPQKDEGNNKGITSFIQIAKENITRRMVTLTSKNVKTNKSMKNTKSMKNMRKKKNVNDPNGKK